MDHVTRAEDLIVRAQYLATELLIDEFQVKFVVDGDDVSFISICRDEVESRIRGYVYEGFSVQVNVEDNKVTIEAKDVF